MICMQIGSMPPELVRKNTELFAREVMPHMRDLWPDFEDKWSAKPMPESERAIPAPINFERQAARPTARPSHAAAAATASDEPEREVMKTPENSRRQVLSRDSTTSAAAIRCSTFMVRAACSGIDPFLEGARQELQGYRAAFARLRRIDRRRADRRCHRRGAVLPSVDGRTGNPDRLHLVGHSMGGMLAAEVAALESIARRNWSWSARAGFWIDETSDSGFLRARPERARLVLFHDPQSRLSRRCSWRDPAQT